MPAAAGFRQMRRRLAVLPAAGVVAVGAGVAALALPFRQTR
jgi:hypothetical protein